MMPPQHTDRSPEVPPPAVQAWVAALSDRGRVREGNEDAFIVADPAHGAPAPLDSQPCRLEVGLRGLLLMVADGMGGARAGEVASRMAVTAVHDVLRAGDAPTDAPAFADALCRATEEANRRVHAHAMAHPALGGMGTTATVAGIFHDELFVAQVGDSRAYVVRDGNAVQVTRDQSLIQRLLEAGTITPEEAERSTRRNIILQALGPEAEVRVDLTRQRLRDGDLVVLCTDGLSALVSPAEIARAADAADDPDALCRTLVELANSRGGPDNVTVVAARLSGAVLRSPEPSDTIGYRRFPSGPVDTVPAEPGTARTRAHRSAPSAPSAPAEVSEPAGRTQAGADTEPTARDRRVRPILMALRLLAAVVAAWTLWQLVGGD